MNVQAQEKWKALYRLAMIYRSNGVDDIADEMLSDVVQYRYAALLERKLAAAQRTIEAQAKRLDEFMNVLYALDDVRTCAQYTGGKYTISGELFDEVVLTLEAVEP